MPQKANLQRSLVVVYIWHGKAYLPTQAQFESGIFFGIEPVLICAVNSTELTGVIQVMKDAGHERLPEPKTREEFLTRKDVVLAETGARSWKQLAKTGVAYTISWKENVRIDMSRLDKKGRWENDPDRVQILPLDTPIERFLEHSIHCGSSG